MVLDWVEVGRMTGVTDNTFDFFLKGDAGLDFCLDMQNLHTCGWNMLGGVQSDWIE